MANHKRKWKPKKYSSAHVHGLLCDYCMWHKSKRAERKAPTIKEWSQ